MQDLFVFVVIGVAAVYLGWRWFGKSGSSCGCGCSCGEHSSLNKKREHELIEDHRQK